MSRHAQHEQPVETLGVEIGDERITASYATSSR
jgi:hypothetical protein